MRRARRWRVVTVSNSPSPRPERVGSVARPAVLITAHGVRWVKITGVGSFRWVTQREKATVFRDVEQAEAVVRGFLMLCNTDATVEAVSPRK